MEPSLPYSIDDIISELADNDQPLLSTHMVELSGLNSTELADFEETWETIDPIRRRQIISRLVELAEDNPLLDFYDIFKYCLQDEDAEVQCQAIEGLWDNEEISMINSLLELLEQTNSEIVQAAAAMALSKYTLLAEYGKLPTDYTALIQEALLKIFDDNNRPNEVRRRALEAASPLSIPEVSTAIREAYESDNIRLKVSAVYAMGRNCDPSWLPMLITELTSNDTELRYEAVVACGELENETAVPHLIELTDDPDSDVMIAALQALGKIGSVDAREYLEQCRSSTNEVIQQIAEQTLEDMTINENPMSFHLPIDKE